MKKLNLPMYIFALALLGIGCDCEGEPFHAGRSGDCTGCHGPNGAVNGYTTLREIDPGSTCLMCHAAANPTEHQIATYPPPPPGLPPKSLTPGGDFAYLQKNYTWTDSRGNRSTSPGERHGHNIIAAAYGYSRDTTLFVSPGGSYRSSDLSCISCHDPHGTYRIVDTSGTIATGGLPIGGSGSYGAAPTSTQAVGTYRLLAGKGYHTKLTTHTFQYDPPIAVSPVAYNRSETTTDTRVAYGKGVSKWCANCHEGFLSGAGGNHTHPVDVTLNPTVAGIYNMYITSGHLNGSQPAAYSSLVPFQNEDMTDAQQLLMVTTSTAGPNPNDKMICLTCHRVHASGWDSITRWNMRGEFLTIGGNYPGIDTSGKGSSGEISTGKTSAEYKKALYDRDAAKFAPYQRSLCNKCHARD